jgi:tetratricopeptide (TPR) repeat protein
MRLWLRQILDLRSKIPAGVRPSFWKATLLAFSVPSCIGLISFILLLARQQLQQQLLQVNREQAERCRDLGATAMRQGNYPKAIKFLTKSLQLYDALPGVAALLAQANGLQQQQSSGTGSARTSNGASSSHAAPARSASTASSATSTDQTGADGRAYTEEQVRIVKKVLAARQGGRGAHYRVLGLTQSCSEAEIKKAYRKLSLKVHPDKNCKYCPREAPLPKGIIYTLLLSKTGVLTPTLYDHSGSASGRSLQGGGFGLCDLE